MQLPSRMQDARIRQTSSADHSQLSPTAAFTSDLGLDSLDSVEVVMAIEEEFGIEIPDEEADKITTVAEGGPLSCSAQAHADFLAIDYIGKTSEGELHVRCGDGS